MKIEDLEMRQGMRDYAAKLALTYPPPPATQVWLRAKQRRRQACLKRAEQPMRIMQTLAFACVLVLAAWLTQHTGPLTTLTGAKTPLLIAASATIVASIAACWTMLHASRCTS